MKTSRHYFFMLQLLFSLLGGVALILIPVFFLSFAAEAKKVPVVVLLALLSFFAWLGAIYLALSFWLFGVIPLFLLSSGVTFYLCRQSAKKEPDFVVEDTLLSQSLSPELQDRLTQELQEGEEK